MTKILVLLLALAATLIHPPTADATPAEGVAPTSPLMPYVLGAMRAWAPPAGGHEEELYASIAQDIATVVADPAEEPLWGDDASRARTAMLLTAVAFYEGRFSRYVDEGVCNDPRLRVAYRGLLATGDCDGGRAFSQWQVHTAGGIQLTDDGAWRYSPRGYRGRDLLADRAVAARVALHMLRWSLRRGGRLCSYTGELGPCPKADERLRLAARWAAEHPL